MAQSYAGVPPGPLSAWLGVREANRAGGLQDLQEVAGVHGLLAKIQQQKEMEQIKLSVADAQGNPSRAVENLIKLGSPTALKLASDMKALLPKPAEPYTLSPGATRYSAEGKPVATAPMAPPQPKAPEPFTLAPGATRYSPEGKPIASVPAAPKEPQPPVVVTDQFGNTKLFTREGVLIRDLGPIGKPNAEILKEQMARAKMKRDLDSIIPTLEDISKEGGLLDKATGSGAGALVDIAAGFVGIGTPGAIAIGQLKPATDAVLKLVPRFEGPQSDKDLKTYQEAAGNLANPNVPNSIRKEAAKEILRMYRKRRNQFITKDYEAAAGAAPAGTQTPEAPDPLGIR